MLKINRLISAALLLILLCSIIVLPACAQTAGLADKDKQALIDTAVSYQTGDKVYNADTYQVTKLVKGQIIYGMLPGQTVFYTDQATVDKGKGSYKTLYSLLQIRPHPTYGYRTKLGKYEVLNNMWVASGTCLSNKTITVDGKAENLGDGGGFQYVIFDYKTSLKELEEIDLHE